MDVQEVLDAAIRKEQAACELYSRTAAESPAPGARALLSELAEQERQHREALESLDPASLGAFEPDLRQDLKIAEYLEDRPLDPDAGLQDIVIYAMHREEEARDFYRRMADSAPGEELRELFGKLAAMERGHKGRLEEFYEQRLMGDG